MSRDQVEGDELCYATFFLFSFDEDERMNATANRKKNPRSKITHEKTPPKNWANKTKHSEKKKVKEDSKKKKREKSFSEQHFIVVRWMCFGSVETSFYWLVCDVLNLVLLSSISRQKERKKDDLSAHRLVQSLDGTMLSEKKCAKRNGKKKTLFFFTFPFCFSLIIRLLCWANRTLVPSTIFKTCLFSLQIISFQFLFLFYARLFFLARCAQLNCTGVRK